VAFQLQKLVHLFWMLALDVLTLSHVENQWAVDKLSHAANDPTQSRVKRTAAFSSRTFSFSTSWHRAHHRCTFEGRWAGCGAAAFRPVGLAQRVK
jgi:hypothetical protein